MVSKNIYLSLVILLIISSQIVAREMNSEDPASLTQAMIGNSTSEAKGVRHVLKYLGKIFKSGKVIYCNTCESCNGLCGYCCN
ncbi:hypothetical protein R3W88_025913 [Solanum pinnatisectum]|uniref:Uncharacterized protein n=1 Tax=Solanum pinnatisectum TaxID=50273 RepID=A0AAV9M4E5_9SOLN|nr:hypothetical protein R3W88_025913 [Solanum pinnatisectum]